MMHPHTRLHPSVTIAATTVTVAALLAIAIMIGLVPRPAAKEPAPSGQIAAQAQGASRPDVQATLADSMTRAAPERPQQRASTPLAPKSAPVPAAQTQNRPARATATAQTTPSGVGRTQTPARSQAIAARAAAAAPVCTSCGTVTSVRTVQRQGEAGLIGPVAGGVIGGAIGSRIGSGSGKAIATIAGAAGGAAVGTEIERRAKASTHYVVSVRMDNGGSRTFDFTAPPGVSSGDRVRVSGDTLVRA